MADWYDMAPHVEQQLSRRQFLRISGVLSVGLAAAALGLILPSDEIWARTVKSRPTIKVAHKLKKNSSHPSRHRKSASRQKNPRHRGRYTKRFKTNNRYAKTNHAKEITDARPHGYVLTQDDHERGLHLYNVHTGETINTIYWADGMYFPDSLKELSKFMRDHYTGDIVDIDPQLFDLLYNLCGRTEYGKPFHILSGYRCPATNIMLREQDSGVAFSSLHMNGMAVDLRAPGLHTRYLRKVALDIQSGGVGYYPDADFIHVDTGPVRHW